jgi:hypothetical protein
LWTFLPWWTPYALAALFVLVLLAHTVRRGRAPRASAVRPRMPRGAYGWIGTVTLGAVAAASGWVAVQAWLARTPPAGRQVVDLEFPLRGGPYLVVHGGSRPVLNAHLKTLDAGVVRYGRFRGQSHGVDLVKLGRFGLRAPGIRPRDPAAYAIFGEPVHVPCGGEVLLAHDGQPDLPVPEADRERLAGNFVLIRCAQADVVLAHLRRGSLRVRSGEVVSAGAWLGEVGNSGSTDEPHLHVHAQAPGTLEEPLAGEPLPVRFGGRYLVRNERVFLPAQDSATMVFAPFRQSPP